MLKALEDQLTSSMGSTQQQSGMSYNIIFFRNKEDCGPNTNKIAEGGLIGKPDMELGRHIDGDECQPGQHAHSSTRVKVVATLCGVRTHQTNMARLSSPGSAHGESPIDVS